MGSKNIFTKLRETFSFRTFPSLVKRGEIHKLNSQSYKSGTDKGEPQGCVLKNDKQKHGGGEEHSFRSKKVYQSKRNYMFNFLGMLIRKHAGYTSSKSNKKSSTTYLLGTTSAATRTMTYRLCAFLHLLLLFVFCFHFPVCC